MYVYSITTSAIHSPNQGQDFCIEKSRCGSFGSFRAMPEAIWGMGNGEWAMGNVGKMDNLCGENQKQGEEKMDKIAKTV